MSGTLGACRYHSMEAPARALAYIAEASENITPSIYKKKRVHTMLKQDYIGRDTYHLHVVRVHGVLELIEDCFLVQRALVLRAGKSPSHAAQVVQERLDIRLVLDAHLSQLHNDVYI